MRLPLISLLVWLNACGGTTDAPDAATADSGGASASGAGGQTTGGQTAGQAGKATGGSAGSISAGGAGGVAGGVAGEDQPLLPLVRGHRSSFVFSPIDAGKPMTDTCDNPTTAVESDEALTLDGHTGPLYLTFCGVDPFLIEGEGDDLTAYEVKNGALVLPAFAYIHSPVQTGEMWDSGYGERFTWQEAPEPIVTPAGTFDHCWHRQSTDSVMTYCRGMGLVHAVGTYGNFELDLVEKNF